MGEPDVPELVRRYLRAFGPATAADVTAWSAVTRLGPVLKAMDDLVQHEDEDGKVLFDVDGAPIADEDAPAPVRLLGTYDNVWLSHAARDRVTDPEARKSWMGTNGGVGYTLFVDGWLDRHLAGHRRTLRGRPARPASSPSSTRGRGPTLADRSRVQGRVESLHRRSLTRPAPDDRIHASPSGWCATAAPRRRRPRPSTSGAPRRRGGRRPHLRRRTRRPRRRSVRPRGRPRPRSRPRPARRSRRAARSASSCSTTARSAPPISAATSAVVARGGTTGCQARRACLAASRAVLCHFACDFAARSPFQTATLRAAAQGHDPRRTDLGQHLDRELAAVALGQRLHDGHVGVGSATSGPRSPARRRPASTSG